VPDPQAPARGERWTVFVCIECGVIGCGLHGDRMPVEVVSAAAFEAVRTEAEELREALFERAKASGEDVSDGPPDLPPIQEAMG
jgi:hypothetical protein